MRALVRYTQEVQEVYGPLLSALSSLLETVNSHSQSSEGRLSNDLIVKRQ